MFWSSPPAFEGRGDRNIYALAKKLIPSAPTGAYSSIRGQPPEDAESEDATPR